MAITSSPASNVVEMASLRSVGSKLNGHAAIGLTTGCGVIASDGLVHTVAPHLKAGGIDLTADEIVADTRGASLGKAIVVVGIAHAVGMAADVDQGLVVFLKDRGHRIESPEMLPPDIGAAGGEGDVTGHIEGNLVAGATHAHSGSLKLSTKLGFLLVHIRADPTSGEGSDPCSDHGALAAVGASAAGQGSGGRTQKTADDSSRGGFGTLSFTRVGIGGLTGRQGEDADEEESDCFHEPINALTFPNIQ